MGEGGREGEGEKQENSLDCTLAAVTDHPIPPPSGWQQLAASPSASLPLPSSSSLLYPSILSLLFPPLQQQLPFVAMLCSIPSLLLSACCFTRACLRRAAARLAGGSNLFARDARRGHLCRGRPQNLVAAAGTSCCARASCRSHNR